MKIAKRPGKDVDSNRDTR